MTDIFGQDITLDSSGQAKVTASGEVVLTEGAETGVQDIRLRIGTRLGTLFYDVDFGSLVPDWIHEESTAASRLAFESEVTRRVELDPRVVIGSVRCRVVLFDERRIQAVLEWRFIDEDQPFNLVLGLDKNLKELVIEDVEPAIS